ncbi:MAG: hypothetical protein J5641_02705 [Bacteroidales bacterium]|nr:hypothetical protein [Bacteroidales bacterium]
MIITTDNYEEYFYRYCEGGLTADERAAVEAFAARHPELAEELALYDPALKLEEAPMPFPDKESLLRHEAKVVPLWRWAAAACVAAVLIGGVWRMLPDGSNPTSEPTVVTAQLQKPLPKTEAPELEAQPMTMPHPAVAPAETPVGQAKTDAPIIDEQIGQLPQYEPPTSDEPLLIAAAEPLPEPQTEDTTVIEYIDIMLMPTRMSETEMLLVTSQPTVGDRIRAFRNRLGNTIRDYAYQTYSEARGELLTRISSFNKTINNIES